MLVIEASVFPQIPSMPFLVNDRIQDALPCYIWLPFELTDANYWYLYTYETVAAFVAVLTANATVMVAWLFWQTNLHYDILAERVKLIVKSVKSRNLNFCEQAKLEHNMIADISQHEQEVIR